MTSIFDNPRGPGWRSRLLSVGEPTVLNLPHVPGVSILTYRAPRGTARRRHLTRTQRRQAKRRATARLRQLATDARAAFLTHDFYGALPKLRVEPTFGATDRPPITICFGATFTEYSLRPYGYLTTTE